MKKILSLLLCALLLCGLCACGGTEVTAPAATADPNLPLTEETHDIVILFTNDVHGAIADNIGYAGLAAYKKTVEARTPYVTLVDCGDAVQGGYLNSVSRGEISARAMRCVGYDLATLGNHEFDFGMERLAELMDISGAEYLCCNLDYTGSSENPLGELTPYEIYTYGDTRVAFIGVATPRTIGDSTPTYFMEGDEYVWDFHGGGENGQELFSLVQDTVDECRAQGADYVVVLSHLGMEEGSLPFTSENLAANTRGIDVILDAHSHTAAPCEITENAEGEEVLLSQTGTGLTAIGQVVISADGYISVGYISDYNKRDAEAEAAIAALTEEYEALLNEVVAYAETELSITDENGIRLVRSRETAIGNLCADAFRTVMGADIAYVNGGGIRASLPAGDITYSDLINVHPFSNTMCVSEITGAELLDMLEYFYRYVQSEYVSDGTAVGEDGSFACMAGVTCTVNTAIPSSVTVDENDMLLSVDGERRVSGVMVLQNGVYVPLDTEATYTLAATDYVLKNGGCGMQLLLADRTPVTETARADYEVLADYIVNTLQGDLSAYSAPAGLLTLTGE